MPPLRSFNRDARIARPARSVWPWILIGLGGVIAVVAAALPASLITDFFPPSVHAEDFSGTIWHGSAGRISVNAHDAGALEWRIHPLSLLKLAATADFHWVKVGFVIDGVANIGRRGYTAHEILGHGPIEDLSDLGLTAGWRGTADINFSEITGDFTKPSAAVGQITVLNLTSAQLADGADLGNYELRLPRGAVSADGSVNAELRDAGGPLETLARIRLSPAERSGLVSGTVRERGEASAGLRRQLDGLAQIRGRDSQGRIAVDLEFSF